MAKTPIRDSLEIIDVQLCGVSEDQVREMVDKLGFISINDICAYNG
jgi:hypothetical protein